METHRGRSRGWGVLGVRTPKLHKEGGGGGNVVYMRTEVPRFST